MRLLRQRQQDIFWIKLLNHQQQMLQEQKQILLNLMLSINLQELVRNLLMMLSVLEHISRLRKDISRLRKELTEFLKMRTKHTSQLRKKLTAFLKMQTKHMSRLRIVFRQLQKSVTK